MGPAFYSGRGNMEHLEMVFIQQTFLRHTTGNGGIECKDGYDWRKISWKIPSLPLPQYAPGFSESSAIACWFATAVPAGELWYMRKTLAAFARAILCVSSTAEP